MEKCADLLPDYFSFVKGVVDSPDLTLNISRETLQHDHILKVIAKNLEKKIKTELLRLMKDDREKYEKFFSAFGIQLKFGLYSDYGMHKDVLQDLVMFRSSAEKKLVTFAEYVDHMPEGQKTIYYASGETAEKIDMLPQAEQVRAKGYEILYCTDDVDEFALQMQREYKEKTFTNICADNLDLDTEEEKAELEKANEEYKELCDFIKESLDGKVDKVVLTNKLRTSPACLTSEGMLSLEMEKVLSAMPNAPGAKARLYLDLNRDHPVFEMLKDIFENDREKLKDYSSILYTLSGLIAGKGIDDPASFSELICGIM